jgi:dihydroflavonol-4-reductase
MITITGAAGHLGNVLIRALTKEKEKLRAIVFPGENYASLKDLDIEIYFCDIRDKKSLNLALEKATIVYHLASLISIGKTSKEELIKTNYEGTQNVLDACIKNKVKKLIYTSSIHAFEAFKMGTITEECRIAPSLALGNYGCTKAMATNLVSEYVKKGALDARIACPTGIIGPYDYKDSEMGHLIKMYLEKKLPIVINGSYDFVDVRDVATGLTLLAERGTPGEIYLFPGNNINIKDFFKLLSNITGYNKIPWLLPNFLIKPALVVMKNYYAFSKEKPLFTEEAVKILNSNSTVSGEKAKRELGYSVRSLRETLEATVLWIKKQYGIK